MQGIAKKNSVCRVCGGQIYAGHTQIAYAPKLSNSECHVECYGKPFKFDPKGNSLDGIDSLPMSLASTTMPQSNIPVENDKETDQKIKEAIQSAVEDYLSKDSPPWEEDNKESKPPATTSKKSKADLKNEGGSEESSKNEDPLTKEIKKIVREEVGTSMTKSWATLENRLEKKVEEAVKKFPSEDKGIHTIIVKNQNNDVVSKVEGLSHYLTPLLIKLMSARKNLYLYGPHGSGKSTAIRIAASAIKTEAHPNGLPYYYVSLNPQSSPTRLEGFVTPHGEMVKSLLYKAAREGGVFDAAEADNTTGNIWTGFNNLLDSDLCSFPDGMFKKHPDFIFVANGNTNLKGDLVYRDRKPLDPATISRLTFVKWDYDTTLEKNIVKARNPEHGLDWANWVIRIREWSKTHNPSLYVNAHPRASIDGADYLALGLGIEEVAEMVVWKGHFDSTAIKAALTAVPYPKIVKKAAA